MDGNSGRISRHPARCISDCGNGPGLPVPGYSSPATRGAARSARGGVCHCRLIPVSGGTGRSPVSFGKTDGETTYRSGLIYAGLGQIPAVVHWSEYYWVYIFAFAIGFSTTVAEPALLAVAIKAQQVSGGAIGIWGLRIAVALGVAVGLALGSYRIVTGLPIHYFIIAGYVVVVMQTMVAPRLIIPLAYDSGGVTTSTVTVPLVAALGLGLAETVPGRNVLIDGFGLIAFASLFPIMSVMAYAQISGYRAWRGRSRNSESN